MGRYESPNYDIVKKAAPFEVRKYAAFSTTSVKEDRLSGQYGFGRLFKYISGENDRREKMAMTVPVINEIEKDTMTMEFVIPSKYTVETIPHPIDPSLVTKHYPAHMAAAVVFSGRMKKNKIALMREKLQAFLETEGLVAKGNFRLARYNPPFSLPFLRRNEIVIEVDGLN